MILLLAISAVCLIIKGEATVINPRIIGGSPVNNISEIPYQVALLRDFGSGFAQDCGGAIISSNVILSAAQCTAGTRPTEWRIRAGTIKHNSGGQVVDVLRFQQHSGFTSRNDNDICLLFLASHLAIGPEIAAVKLPFQGQKVEDGALATVAGWGSLTVGVSRAEQLHKMIVPIVNHEQCIASYIGLSLVSDNMICAGLLNVGGVDRCTYDTGGPMVIDGIVVGIVSWGRGCACPEYPSVYTRVSNYRSWIDSITQ